MLSLSLVVCCWIAFDARCLCCSLCFFSAVAEIYPWQDGLCGTLSVTRLLCDALLVFLLTLRLVCRRRGAGHFCSALLSIIGFSGCLLAWFDVAVSTGFLGFGNAFVFCLCGRVGLIPFQVI